jgi:hypothetical protein
MLALQSLRRSGPICSYQMARASAPAPRVLTLKGAQELHFRGSVFVYYCSTCYKDVRVGGGGGENGGHVLREATS